MRYWNGTTAQKRLRHIISLSQYRRHSKNKNLDIIISEGNDIPEALLRQVHESPGGSPDRRGDDSPHSEELREGDVELGQGAEAEA